MSFDPITIKEVKGRITELLKLLRKQQDISQEELAEALDLSRITIQNLEAGKNITLDTILKVMQHFDLLETLDQALQEEISNKAYKSLY